MHGYFIQLLSWLIICVFFLLLKEMINLQVKYSGQTRCEDAAVI